MKDYCKKCRRPFDSGDDAIEVCDCNEQSAATTPGPTRIVASAHRLAMLALQSGRYSSDHEYRDAVDAVLLWSVPAWAAQRQTRTEKV